MELRPGIDESVIFYTKEGHDSSSPPLKPFIPDLEPGTDCEILAPNDFLEPDEENIAEPWDAGLRLRPKPAETWSLRIEEWIEESSFTSGSRKQAASWNDGLLLAHMATDHGYDAVAEGRRYQLPGIEDSTSNERIDSLAHSYQYRSPFENRVPAFDQNPKRARTDRSKSSALKTIDKTVQPRALLREISSRRRKVLPMMFETKCERISIAACPDTGSDVNIISLETARRLGFSSDIRKTEEVDFRLANNQPIKAIGQVDIACSFGAGTPWHDQSLYCIFQIFNSLSVPLIMGMQFLEMTETYSKYQDRLVEETVPRMHSLQISSVGRPRKSLICRLNAFVSLATADTGSDIDLISADYARSRGFQIDEVFHNIMLADGTVEQTCGLIRSSFTVGLVDDVRGFISKSQNISIDFFVLSNLSSDVLIGQDTIEELNIFANYSESFVPNISLTGESDVNIIRYIGKAERAGKRLWAQIRGDNQTSNPSSAADIERKWELDDQRENARREARHAEIDQMAEEHREAAKMAEATRISNYEATKTARKGPESNLRSGSPNYDTRSTIANYGQSPSSVDESSFETDSTTSASGQYVCSYSGCTAPPFQTQYLLNSHANFHSSSRPHYCPHIGCPRSEGGKGFKRKNEMIRHGIVHDSPGYHCPFCPDPAPRYPRPDNLQRHVRVHHPTHDKDDSQLREALSERFPKRPERGRR
ncbi:unnamed protein product [Clonostachys solani]|uniref:C2H2-type domain-containing protein n=1 Tax=Clonostachys solani TaxID=160281 RepID=A0A9N9ZLL5_9HYPO|nr:unnamed protein product [Clonostachys solani]